MKIDNEYTYSKAIALLTKGMAKEALVIAESLVRSSNESDRLDGYMSMGAIYEEGGRGVPPDFSLATKAYRKAAAIEPSEITFLNVARTQLLSGQYQDCLRSLNAASTYGKSPELLLGYARYYEINGDEDFLKALDFYYLAALRGRFAGFFGYSRVARLTGKKWKAMWADFLRILLGPLIWLIFGSKARYQF
ncbi:hypothetical protein [Stenotrophomonas sp. PS02298]|uniref:hypothetical protein n=1 Tax=Stenotrophomonas sp. PS02298 TaxID=2991424 RepID=UPI00249CED04|nr:hypothetical protein [Stenotrophomonas sp. PS02298]